MGNMPRHIGGTQKPLAMDEGVVFLLIDMDFRMGEIRQSAAMVKVHVRQDDMFYIFRLIAQPPHLMDGGFLRVKGHPGDETEELREPGGMCIIIQPQACVDEGQPLIGLKQQADCTCLPPTRDARITGETVEDMDLHSITYNSP